MDWQTILAAASFGLAAVLATMFSGFRGLLGEWFVRVIRKMRTSTYVQRIEKVADFLEVFEDCQKKVPNADCILIFYGHNGGGMPAPGKPYTVRAIYGWCECNLDPLEWYGFENQVDIHYCKMLSDMMKVGYSVQEVDLMPIDAKLRTYFITDGTKYARFYYLGLVDEELIYISFQSKDLKFTDSDIQMMAVLVDKMKSFVEV